MTEQAFGALYPDVLGAITDGLRADLQHLQCALGVFPRQACLNQPVELVLLLQNMIDQPLQIKVTLSLPVQDRQGRLLVLEGPGPSISQGITAGEVGVLRLPVVAYPPSQPGANIPVRVSVSARAGRAGKPIRARSGGALPGHLSVSPFKLQALREVTFNADYRPALPGTLTAFFDLAPTRLPPTHYDLNARYETLWTELDLAGERELAQHQVDLAMKLAGAMTTSSTYWPLYHKTQDKFERRGLDVTPGELTAITKTLAYVLGESTLYERDYTARHSRWFQALCYALLADEAVAEQEPGEIAAAWLYDAVLFDAVVLGLEIVRSRLDEPLMPAEGARAYAEQVAAWLGGYGPVDWRYVYQPLVMAGIALNALVAARTENPWLMIDDLYASIAERRLTVDNGAQQIFDLTERLLRQSDAELRRLNYERP